MIPFYDDFKSKRNGFAVIEAEVADRGNAGKGAANEVYVRDTMRSAKGGPVIGTLYGNCATTGLGIDLCRGVLFLNGRGTLTFAGYASSSSKPHVRTIPIVGGTKELAGARGFMQNANQTDAGPGMPWKIHLLE